MATWKRVERNPNVVDEEDAPPCPMCGEPTENLKQFRCLYWCVFYLVGATWRVEFVRACPKCMRSHLLRRALINIPLSNLLWPILVLPWTAVLYASSYREGHSRAVASGLRPEDEAALEARRNELSWGRVLAIVAILFCWAPIVGLPFALLAFFVNRKSPTWTKPVSIVAAVISGLVHLFLLGLMVVSAVQGA